MTKQADLSYTNDGLFISFLPETEFGEDLWREMAAPSEGTGKFLSVHKTSILRQLRKAGAVVRKAKKSKLTMQDIFDDMEALGI